MGEESTRIDDSIADWESGLPSAADLTPLSQALIPIELASAFKIAAEQPRSMIEVNRASHTTLTSLRSPPNFTDDHLMDESDPPVDENGGSDPKRLRRSEEESFDNCEKAAAAAAKRPRLVWTPQLHKRFVDVVGHLGLKNAVPKTIMQLMNVEGLTRENVASHLQKYRLYVKRMQGLSNEGPSPSDHLFASTPLPPGAQSFNESSSVGGNRDGSNGGSSGNNNNNSSNSHGGMQIMQMPMMGMASGGNEGGNSHYHHHHHHHHYQQQYSNMMQQQRDWSGNQYNSAYSHHVTHTNK